VTLCAVTIRHRTPEPKEAGMSSLTPTDPAAPTATGDEPVTSPDQHKPGHRALDYAGAVISAALLLLLLVGNGANHVEIAWVSGTSIVLLAAVAADLRLRRTGVRHD
jgi:hypothetical protein